jgi:hypothetical protein
MSRFFTVSDVVLTTQAFPVSRSVNVRHFCCYEMSDTFAAMKCPTLLLL